MLEDIVDLNAHHDNEESEGDVEPDGSPSPATPIFHVSQPPPRKCHRLEVPFRVACQITRNER